MTRQVLASLAVLAALLAATAAPATTIPFPTAFRSQMVPAQDATLYVRVGGQGPAVVLIHGFGDTGDMWAPLAADLARDHLVIVPDLRGMGLSSHPAGGYDKRNQAGDIHAVLASLGIDHAAIVGHDIGTMVAYAYALRYRGKVERLAVMDAPIPGLADWSPKEKEQLIQIVRAKSAATELAYLRLTQRSFLFREALLRLGTQITSR